MMREVHLAREAQIWGDGLGGGSLGWGADTLLDRVSLGAYPQHSCAALSPAFLRMPGSRGPGIQIRVTAQSLRGQISRAVCSDTGGSGRGVRLQREALGRKGPTVLFEGM